MPDASPNESAVAGRNTDDRTDNAPILDGRGRLSARIRLDANSLRPDQTEDALLLRIPGNRPARRGLQGLRGRNEGRHRFRAVLEQHAVQAGHRARRAPAREPRTVQSRARRYLQTDTRMVADDLRVSVPRLRPPEEDF